MWQYGDRNRKNSRNVDHYQVYSCIAQPTRAAYEKAEALLGPYRTNYYLQYVKCTQGTRADGMQYSLVHRVTPLIPLIALSVPEPLHY